MKLNPIVHQWLLVMKITFLLLLATLMTVSAKTAAQKITLNTKDATLESVLKEFKKQSGYDFVADQALLENARTVTLHLKNADIGQALKQLFENQQLIYTLEDKVVTIKEKPVAILDKIKNYFAAMDVTGRIVDENNQPLSGATVTVKGTNNATNTDLNGFFTLKQVQPNGIIVISFIGYDKKEIPAIANLGAIKLRVASSKLDEVQVQAYGVTSQRLTTGDITMVTAKEIAEQPVNNPLLTLEGRVPGLVITQANGLAGSGVKVQIRGNSSLTANNSGTDPLIVVDGVPYPTQLLPSIQGILGTSGGTSGAIVGSPLSFINPDDIESISVLKDADATSIYGSRAANGAILITTKKGKVGETQVSFTLQNGIGKVAHFLPLMNTSQYLQMRHEALKNDGKVAGPADYDINGTYDTTRYTNWQKALIGNSAQYLDYNATVSGGSANIQYLIGSTFHRETTVFPFDFSDQKADVHFNISSVSNNKKFHISLTGSYQFDNNHLPQLDLTKYAEQLAPDAPALYDSNGKINWQPNAAGSSTFSSDPAPLALKYYDNKTTNLNASGLIKYELLPRLSLSSTFGYSNLQSNQIFATPLTAYSPSIVAATGNSSRQALYSFNDINSWIVEPQLNFSKTIFGGRLEVLLGGTINQSFTNGTSISTSGQASDAVLLNLSAATFFVASTTAATVYKYNAIFGRINYNWNDKYLINLSIRRDGSSRFGPGNQFHDFESIGSAWIFSNEDLVKKNLPFLSFGKLRASYGVAGSDQIGDYTYMNLYNIYPVAIPYQGIASIVPQGLTNPYLAWMQTKKLDAALDLGFIKDRILLSIDYFRNLTGNQLLNYALPSITGFGSVVENFPATIENKGFDFSFSTKNVSSKNFEWSSNFNISVPENKIVSFPGLGTNTPSNFYKIGEPSNYFQAYHFLGVSPATGLYQFSDGKGGITSSPETNILQSQTTIVDVNPKFYGGFQNTFRYKSLELSIFFRFVKQRGASYYFGTNYPGSFNFELANQPAWLINRWQGVGNNSPYQKYNSTGANNNSFFDAGLSDAAYRDASYIRLQNLSLSWQLPQLWRDKLHFRNARLFLQGQNIFTITNYYGLDPETQSSSSLPTLRVITTGIQITL
jgi:TonB-linked SusC/RagA family outer membrane protein